MTRRASRLVLACALALVPSLASAQRSDDLRTAFREVAFEWARADAGAVVRHMVPNGILIDASDGRMGPLTDRQATAVLRQLFEQGETVAVDIVMLERVGGRPPRAFASIIWTTRPRGTEVPVRRTVYFGLQLIDGAWRVSEIRLIP